VIGERQSRSIIYRADLVTFQSLTSFMVEDCCGGRAELCAPIAACKPARGKRAKVTA
jgi:ArsR family transcriptional regulator